MYLKRRGALENVLRVVTGQITCLEENLPGRTKGRSKYALSGCQICFKLRFCKYKKIADTSFRLLDKGAEITLTLQQFFLCYTNNVKL